ncbi:hypothetical protein B0T21DRAFT_434730 [Apiosordaria backusii]|uniref:Protein kinase domain-containing protein n=1 Tax=Apiosordaria backusii TaxID=314023 RepID=A0AA40ENA3_9PEZI|nr:hypothetical protein B0T21DRAFT_434730 [Apiosordaria backusii]
MPPLRINASYTPGTTLFVHRHTPPEPFGWQYTGQPRPGGGPARADEAADGKIQFALDNPPMEAALSDSDSDGEGGNGDEEMEGGGGKKGKRKRKGKVYVAKIYDGVDYPTRCKSTLAECWREIDCMTKADQEYSLEAHSYATLKSCGLQRKGQPGIAPRFRGSYTFARETGRLSRSGRKKRVRWVRMVLLEFVKGESMKDMTARATTTNSKKKKTGHHGRIDYSLLPSEADRLKVLRQILEAEVRLYWEDTMINHGNLDPSNVMIRPDFSIAITGWTSAELCDFHKKREHPLQEVEDGIRDGPVEVQSPIEEYWPFCPSYRRELTKKGSWKDWIPEAWRKDPRLAGRWLIETFGNDERYEKIDDEWVDEEDMDELGLELWGMACNLMKGRPRYCGC